MHKKCERQISIDGTKYTLAGFKDDKERYMIYILSFGLVKST